MANQPGIVPDNAFTRMANQVSDINRNGGGRLNTADTPPAVSTPAMRRVSPLPQSELDRLDRLAAEAGVEGYEQDVEKPTPDTPLFVALPRVPQTKPFLPDFTKVQAIDLVKRAVIVDGVEFEYAEEDQERHIHYCMEVVMDTLGRLIGRAKIVHNLPVEPAEKNI